VVGVTTVAACAASLAGDWQFVHDPPQGDMVQVFRITEDMYRNGEMQWKGVPSVLPLNHPGPILLFILLFGRIIGSVAGVDPHTTMIGVYVAACVGLVTFSCVAVSRAFSSRAAGVGLLLVYLAMQFVWANQLTQGELVSGWWEKAGLLTYPISPPLIGTYLTLASGAAILALGRWRVAPYACILIGGWNFQVFVENAPVGFVVGAVGVVAVARRAGRGTRRERLGAAALGTCCWILGFGTFLVRMFQEGFDLPWQYVQAAYQAKERIGESAYQASWVGQLEESWYTGQLTGVVLAAMLTVVAVGVTRPATRRLALRAVYAAPLIVFYVAYASTTYPYQTSLLAALVPLAFAGPVGAVLQRIDDRLLRFAVLVLPVMVISAVVHNFPLPMSALDTQRGPELVREAVDDLVGPGSRVAVVVDAALIEQDAAAEENILAIDYQLHRFGFDACSPPPVDGVTAERPLEYTNLTPTCRLDAVDAVVHVRTNRPDNGGIDIQCGNTQLCTVDVYRTDDRAVGGIGQLFPTSQAEPAGGR
jgi:hypothetical protein